MRYSSKFQTVLLLLVLFFVSGCATLLPSYDARITGTVTNASGGEPVAGSRVWINGLTTDFTATAQTNVHGQFAVAVPAGRYELKLTKTEHGTSHVIGLDAFGPTHINIIQRATFNPRWSTRPPRINLQGISEGGRYQGEIPFRVDVEADNGMDLLYVALGKTPGSSFLTAPRQAYSQVTTSGDQVIDPNDYGVRGPTTFEVVAYDKNGNRTHLIRHIDILPDGGPVFEPENLKAIAVTLGQQILFFGGHRPGPDPTIEAAPAGANVYVELSWEASPTADIDGYHLYRSTNGVTFSQIASVGPQQLSYRDSGPALTVGHPVHYRVSAFRNGNESAWSNLALTTPLEAWDVRLVSPADEAIGVSNTPTFRWRPTRRVGRHQIYGVLLWDTALGSSTFWITPDPPDYSEQVSWTWNQAGRYTGTPWQTLQPNRVYEWEVAYAVAVDDLDHPTAVSVAANRFGLGHPNIPIANIGLDTTDNFSFTTGN